MKGKFPWLLLVIVCTIVCSENILAQARYSIVISEIMADPTPQIGLPNAEWIELRNASSTAINLQGFRLQKPGSTASGAMPSLVLAPDSCVVVCTASQVAGLSVFGRTISVTSFTSLSNDADELMLLAPNGSVMHAVSYSSSWYNNAVKADGGWTLEMIDVKNACTGTGNWTASTDAKGGTPGAINSANKVNADNRAPRLLYAAASNVLLAQLVFDETMDSSRLATSSNYQISNGINVITATPVAPFFNRVNLLLSAPLMGNTIYTVDANNVTDCSGNAVDNNFSRVKLGSFGTADSNDVVVNEILFNPNPQGVDYVELYNRSNKIINVQQLVLANRSSNGSVGTFGSILTDNFPLFPQEYLVVSTDPATVAQQYTVMKPGLSVKIAGSMPSYPDDKGTVLLLNNAGRILDEIAYDDNWHFALINNKEGIALERIDANATSNNKDNWTSAAKTVGYGTPTAANSQQKTAVANTASISIQPSIFSPDNDGFEDFALIQYQFAQPGYVANITIMDAAGRPAKVLQRNATCGISGNFRWDGLNDKLQKVPVGTYIVFTEIFNLQGRRQVFKNTVTIAKKF